MERPSELPIYSLSGLPGAMYRELMRLFHLSPFPEGRVSYFMKLLSCGLNQYRPSNVPSQMRP